MRSPKEKELKKVFLSVVTKNFFSGELNFLINLKVLRTLLLLLQTKKVNFLCQVETIRRIFLCNEIEIEKISINCACELKIYVFNMLKEDFNGKFFARHFWSWLRAFSRENLLQSVKGGKFFVLASFRRFLKKNWNFLTNFSNFEFITKILILFVFWILKFLSNKFLKFQFLNQNFKFLMNFRNFEFFKIWIFNEFLKFWIFNESSKFEFFEILIFNEFSNFEFLTNFWNLNFSKFEFLTNFRNLKILKQSLNFLTNFWNLKF